MGRGRVPSWIIAHCASYIQSPSSFLWTDESTGSMYLILLSIYLKNFPIKSALHTPSMWHCGVCFHLLLHIFSPSLSFILDIVHDVFFHTQGFTSTLSNLSVFSMTSRLHGLPRKFFLYPNHVKKLVCVFFWYFHRLLKFWSYLPGIHFWMWGCPPPRGQQQSFYPQSCSQSIMLLCCISYLLLHIELHQNLVA